MIGQDEIDAVTRVLSGPTLVHGAVTREFEQRFAARIGAKHAIAVSSCTAGLHLSLFAQGIGPGDEVIVPAMTHVATAHAAELCGARPVFVDVEPDTGNIDPRRLDGAITSATAAVIVVHYLGLPCDMDSILAIADKAAAILVEDCALSLDATYGDRKTGTFGIAGCFSFYPIKHMTTIEGGMVTTNDDAFAQSVAKRRSFGYDRSHDERKEPGIYDVDALGYNYRMNEVEAAVGLVQLAKLDKLQAARSMNFRILTDILSGTDGITLLRPRKRNARSSHYCLNVVLPQDGSIDRRRLSSSLNEIGIGTSVHYPGPVPAFSYYREKYGYRAGSFPVAEWLAAQTISLPVGPHLNDGDAERIGTEFKRAIEGARRRPSKNVASVTS